VLLFSSGFTASVDFVSLTTACKMDLYRFPFDSQSCKITFQSTLYPSTSETHESVLTNKHKITVYSSKLFDCNIKYNFNVCSHRARDYN